MKTRMNAPLACRHCRHYQFEGRRGGQCQQLGVPVKGEWQPCSLITPNFSSASHQRAVALTIHTPQYVSDIYNYETVAKLKPVKTIRPAKAR
ncbi:MAG: hypothetical protein HC810_03515 [Acaryochloridaceae cyanobacterium RL_2_7]|nr:hypothetical protein [Acaryochloridaceae cyanobacterium RL_2_7]